MSVRDATEAELARALRDKRKERRKASPRRVIQQRTAPVAQGQRRPRMKDKAYLQWVRTLPCVECVRTGAVQLGRTEAAHIRCGYPEASWRPTGMQERPDDIRTAPLCSDHHREGQDAQHAHNERTWWAERNVYPPDLCLELRVAFLAGLPGDAAIRDVVSRRFNGEAVGR